MHKYIFKDFLSYMDPYRAYKSNLAEWKGIK